MTSRLSVTAKAATTAHNARPYNLLQRDRAVSDRAHARASGSTSRLHQIAPPLTTETDAAGAGSGGAGALTDTRSVCGWCLGAHALLDCPHRPRLSLAAAVTFAVTAFARPARGWA